MITVEHLKKKYGAFTAVDDLSFEIEDGHIYGFLGPNGAGKSTTMNMMTGCLSITEGSVKIDGLDIFDDAKEAKKLIGYLPEIPPLYLDSTVSEQLYFVARAKGFAKKDVPAELERVMGKTGLTEVKGKLIKTLSKGYRQRVGIAQAIIGTPKVVILDEPTVGLDPAQIIEIRNLIKELAQDSTVILSTHILSEVQEVCDQVLIISHGKLVAFDKPENLEQSLGAKNLEAVFLELTIGDQQEKAAAAPEESIAQPDAEEAPEEEPQAVESPEDEPQAEEAEKEEEA